MFVSGNQSRHWDEDHRGRDSLEEGSHRCSYDSQQSLCLVVLEIQEHRVARDQAGMGRGEEITTLNVH